VTDQQAAVIDELLAEHSSPADEMALATSGVFAPAVRTWAYAPGAQAQYWEEFYRDGIMAMAADELGDLKQYSDKDTIANRIVELYKPERRSVNDSLSYFEFANTVAPGDRVIAKKGINGIVGYGVVTGGYEYRSTRDHYRHVRTVRWDGRGVWKAEGNLFPQKALTDLSEDADTIAEIDRILGLLGESAVTPPTLSAYTIEQALDGIAFDPRAFEDMLRVWEKKKNLILQGAPGVGKTLLARRLAYALIGYDLPSHVGVVQFHQSYAYEDFIQGYRPSASGFERRDGVFVRFCNKARKDQQSRYVFVIDEINRGNISKVFGELLMLIEKDYRGSRYSISLAYSSQDEEQFYVPENVYILGLMNTADRSLALVDYALRRRFSFERIKPLYGQDSFTKFLEAGGTDSRLANAISARLLELNEEITEDSNLGSGFCVGHSYFCQRNRALTPEDFFDAIRNEIIPLLEEYWLDDRERIKKWRDKLLAAF
jgi:5-methylcytosine-specific restriction protein B